MGRAMVKRGSVWGCVLLAFLAGGVASAAELRGQVALVTPGQDASPVYDLNQTAVIFKPDTPLTLHPLPSGVSMTMRGKSFVPHVLLVTVGTTVTFPNADYILHNAFSTTPADSFDMGLYNHGKGKSVNFDHPALVRVYCNVHHQMFAYILVLDTPYFVMADAAGRFDLRHLPPGPGELIVWHPRARLWRTHLADTGGAVQVTLAAVRRGIPPHFNKYGRPYVNTPTY